MEPSEILEMGSVRLSISDVDLSVERQERERHSELLSQISVIYN